MSAARYAVYIGTGLVVGAAIISNGLERHSSASSTGSADHRRGTAEFKDAKACFAPMDNVVLADPKSAAGQVLARGSSDDRYRTMLSHLDFCPDEPNIPASYTAAFRVNRDPG